MITDLEKADDEEFAAHSEERKDKPNKTVEQKRPRTTTKKATRPANKNDSISSPSSRNSRPGKHEGPWVPDYAGTEFLAISPSILKLKDGSYIELRCGICNGNSSWAHHTFNKGVFGFRSHFRQVHKDESEPDVVLQRCKHRDVSAEEIESLMNGESQIEEIPCDSKTRLDNQKAYIGKPVDTTGPQPRRAGHTVESLAAAKAAKDAKTTAKAPATAATTTASSSNPPPTTPKRRKLNPSASNTPTNPSTPSSSTSRRRDTSLPSLTNCSIVVQSLSTDGTQTYHELRCDICGGNGSFASGNLLNGIKGFKMHFNQIHHEQLTTADIMRRCSHREVPMDEVRRIQNGEANLGFIKCDHSPNVRPKASYKDFNSAERS